MNRLWIRISLSIAGIVIVGMLLPIAVGIATREFNDQNESSPKLREEIAWETLSEEEKQALIDTPPNHPGPPFPGRNALSRMTPYLIGATVASLLFGVLLSRWISAPLSNLSLAARQIGRRDLSPRVAVRGSLEIQELTQSFNQMAADLEKAETLRKNLLADVAHELRTPLTVLQGNLQAILDDVYQLDKIEIARLYDQTRQLSRLVEDLHELAQAEAEKLALDFVEIDLGKLISDITHGYAPITESTGITLKNWILEGLPTIQGDRRRLTQCIQNLLNNAIRHTPAGGEINLTARLLSDAIQIQIVDTGSGIAPEHLPHIFDRFYRADPARNRQTGGAGLGLAITRAIIKAHGGQIQIESAGLGHGSTVTFTLPHPHFLPQG